MEVDIELLENKDVYRFQDFTHSSYRNYIEQILQKNYLFSFYHNFDRDSKFVLFRHDVDFSPIRALKLARIEIDCGVRSTFFIQPHCRFYHLLEKSIHDIFMEIKEMGHELGLHFDFAFYSNFDESSIEEKLRNEKDLIDTFFGTDIKVFSFHNPNQWALNWGEWECADMINTYAEYFMKEVRYGSDSNGIWRHENFEEIILSDPDCLQLLTHPVWWTTEISSPKQRVFDTIKGRCETNKQSQLELWKKWDRPLIDWN